MKKLAPWILATGVSLLVGAGIGYLLFRPAGTPSARLAQSAKALWDLEFTPAQLDRLQTDLDEYRQAYQDLRTECAPPNSLAPVLEFHPRPAAPPPAWLQARVASADARFSGTDLERLAFADIETLSALLRTRQITSEALTRMFLHRLEKADPRLKCVVTLTAERALEQARQADREISAGHYRGPLHGIPFGAKDLLAARGYPTTWGTPPYRKQQFGTDATVLRKLEEAGAVLVAKLSLGELAWGDVWFGGMTRNPWDLEQGSSGSSAGSSAAVSAGLVPFALGTETWGSIVSPCTRCGVTGLRPTFGRVSRTGAMTLSWSMDKIGPIARTAADCATVLAAIQGPDGQDHTVMDVPFSLPAKAALGEVAIGYLPEIEGKPYAFQANDQAVLKILRGSGAKIERLALPEKPIEPLAFILSAEAAAAFDELTRSGQLDRMVRQERDSWPVVFRSARFIPAVEYLQANRHRAKLVDAMNELMNRVDVLVAPSLHGQALLLTNLTGHPCVVVPNGFDADGHPTSICFIGRLFDEASPVAVAMAYQAATDFHLRHPPAFHGAVNK